jgi:16S rRNA (uracil1498-N3)-methyltransferase
MVDRSVKVRLYLKDKISLGLAITLSADQAKYLFKVMRLNIGQDISIIDGNTGEYLAKIVEKNARFGKVQVIKQLKSITLPPDLWLFFAPLKKVRTEFIIEKATELGVRKIIPIITSRTLLTGFRISRLKTIMVEALEQCGGTFLPTLIEPIKLVEALGSWPAERQLVFCDETLSQTPRSDPYTTFDRQKSAGILIGPEGGFSPSESQAIRKMKNTTSMSLGPRILRADTAVVAAISIWQSVY